MIHCTLALHQVLGCRRPGGTRAVKPSCDVCCDQRFCAGHLPEKVGDLQDHKVGKNDLEHIGWEKRQDKCRGLFCF